MHVQKQQGNDNFHSCVSFLACEKNGKNRQIHFWTYKIPLKKQKQKTVTILHILHVLLLPRGVRTRTQSFRLIQIVSAFLFPNYFFDCVSASSVSESLSQSFMVAPIIKSSLRTLQLGFPGPDSACDNHKYSMSAHFNSLHFMLIVHLMASQFLVVVKYTVSIAHCIVGQATKLAPSSTHDGKPKLPGLLYCFKSCSDHHQKFAAPAQVPKEKEMATRYSLQLYQMSQLYGLHNNS